MLVKIGNTEIEVEARPLTLLVPSAEMVEPIEYPGVFVIDPESTVAHARSFHNLHPAALQVLDKYWPEAGKAWRERPREAQTYQVLHLMGLVNLTLYAQSLEIAFAWKYPETYLHPKHQLTLADFAIACTKGELP